MTDQMSENYFASMSNTEMSRLAAIREKQELFETKLFSLKHSASLEQESGREQEKRHTILIVMRDPGTANALLPVIDKLKDSNNLFFLCDGKALSSLNKEGYDLNDETPDEGLLSENSSLSDQNLNPDLILTSRAASNAGLESFARSTFSDAKIVLIEDIYDSAGDFISRGQESNQSFQKDENMRQADKICVIDEEARDIILSQFPDVPDLDKKIEVTGQPSFDKIYQEDSMAIRQETREDLGVEPNERLVIFFGVSRGVGDSLEKILPQMKELSSSNVKLIFRPHPRDPISPDEYSHLLDQSGVNFIDFNIGNKYTSDEIVNASDVVVTTTSTVTFEAIYRRKPVINITAPSAPNTRSMVEPALNTGASLEVSDLNDFRAVLGNILNNNNNVADQLRDSQEYNFRLDGRNTDRVVQVIEKTLNN
jgi:hypothetical protein